MAMDPAITKLKKVYFPNLNGLRFIAVALVIIHHIEQLKFIFGLPNYWLKCPVILIIGKLGVVLFFALSGFLITYLLMAEENTFQKISIKKFTSGECCAFGRFTF
jgi:peptidoglycan/LPS O-acetylase OafA/YrhL